MFRTKVEGFAVTIGSKAVLVPAGWPLSRKRNGDGSWTYFVENFHDLIPAWDMLLAHDATHYGLVVAPDTVEEIQS